MRVIKRQTQRDIQTSIVTGHRELLVAEGGHEGGTVAGQGPFRHLGMVGSVGWLGGLAITPQVGADDGEVPTQDRRHAMPGRVGSRMAVKQEHRWSRTAMTDSQLRLADVDPAELEPVEHGTHSADDGQPMSARFASLPR